MPLATPPLENSRRLIATASTMAWTKVVARKLGNMRRPPKTMATPVPKYTTQAQRNSVGKALPMAVDGAEIKVQCKQRWRYEQSVEIDQPNDSPGEVSRCGRYGGD